jgi:glycosyltransferase involved in cell wall biosynthesis
MDKTDYIVSVLIVTYNQEQWIAQTIESILAQQTTYPFEVIIGNDCSTDGTQAICESYAAKYDNVRVLTYAKNKGIVGNWVECIKVALGKYIMNCAGDDYWHNPNKIQLQVDFMEKHPNCVISHTDYDRLLVKTNKIVPSYNQTKGIIPPTGSIQKDVLSGKERMTAVTICYRAEELKKYCPLDTYVSMCFPREDWPTTLIMAAYGDVEYIPVSTSTYRVGQVSITNTIDYNKIRRRYQLDKQMTEFLYTLFPEWGPFNDGWWYDTYVYHSLLVAAYENNDYKSANEFAKKDPTDGLLKQMASNPIAFYLYRLYRKLTTK